MNTENALGTIHLTYAGHDLRPGKIVRIESGRRGGLRGLFIVTAVNDHTAELTRHVATALRADPPARSGSRSGTRHGPAISRNARKRW